MSPVLSIIIPTFNRADMLPQTLDSILAQSFTDWECIVVDDGSTDVTPKVMFDYCQKDNRITYHKRPDNQPKGANACRNFGFGISKGDYINWFDSDDIMYPDFLQKKLDQLQTNPNLDFCACLQETFRDDNPAIKEVMAPAKFILESFEADLLINGLSFYTPSPLWRKQFLTDKPLFDTSLSRAQETDFHFRMLSHYPQFVYLKEVLYGIRIGNKSITSQSGLSIYSQQSIYLVFKRAFQVVLKNKPQEQTKLLQYLFYRLSVNYYNQNELSVGILARWSLFKTYAFEVRKFAKQAKLPLQKRIRLTVGVLTLLVACKGYSFFYFPEYDARKIKDEK